MTWKKTGASVAIVWAIAVCVSGCASLGLSSGATDPTPAQETPAQTVASAADAGAVSGRADASRSAPGAGPRTSGGMTVHKLEAIFADQVDAITGSPGAIQTQIDGLAVYCFSDAQNDRMRIIVPFARITGFDPRIYERLLRANFHTALDARYAISEDVLFSAFIHPLSTLTSEEIVSGLNQAVTLAKTFGTTYTSGKLVFPGATEEGAEGEPGAP